jgi:hypothetical protein
MITRRILDIAHMRALNKLIKVRLEHAKKFQGAANETEGIPNTAGANIPVNSGAGGNRPPGVTANQ